MELLERSPGHEEIPGRFVIDSRFAYLPPMPPQHVPEAPPETLRRSLRLVDVAALGVNGVIGTGIFFLPGKVAAMLGPAAVVTFVISAVMCGLLVFCFAEVPSRFRTTGGPMLYAEAAFGRTTGFVVGWLGWPARLASGGALANALFIAAVTLFPAVQDHRTLFLIAAIAVFAGVNAAGVALGAGVTNFFTAAKLLPILLLIGVGVFHIRGELFLPFAPHGFGETGAATLIILYAFVGFETLTVPAGEMRDPVRTIPRALLLVMGLVTIVYLLIWVVCAGVLPGLAGADNPVADAAAVILGPVGGTIVAAGIFISVLGVNAGLALVAPRYLYALSHEGMLPAQLGRVHPRTRTPVTAIAVTATLILALALTGSFAELAMMSIAARLAEYVATSAAMLRFRATRPNEPPAFRAPAGPIVAVLAIGLSLWLLVQSNPVRLAWGGVAIAVGLALHLPLRRRA
jgi:amino acid transporter